MNSWDKAREEIIERLENPTKEEIAKYIEKAYKLGYLKGLNVATDTLSMKLNALNRGMKEGVKAVKESEGL